MREMAVDACVLALGMGRGRSPVSAAPLALQQNILAAFHPDQDAGDAVQAVQEVLNPAAGFSDDVVHDDQGAFPGRLGNSSRAVWTIPSAACSIKSMEGIPSSSVARRSNSRICTAVASFIIAASRLFLHYKNDGLLLQ